MVYDMLMKATKDPNVTVGVDEFMYHKNPKEFMERMQMIREHIGPRGTPEEHIKNQTMDWRRDHTWSLGMKKDHPILKTYIGKESSWYTPIDDTESAILHHLDKVYKY